MSNRIDAPVFILNPGDRTTKRVVTYPGTDFASLRDDQRDYVRHCLASWRADGMFLPRYLLARAIRKALVNRP